MPPSVVGWLVTALEAPAVTIQAAISRVFSAGSAETLPARVPQIHQADPAAIAAGEMAAAGATSVVAAMLRWINASVLDSFQSAGASLE